MTRSFPPAERELVTVNQERIDALVAGDIDTLDRYVGDDMKYLSAAGVEQTKAQVFTRFRSGDLCLEREAPSDLSTAMRCRAKGLEADRFGGAGGVINASGEPELETD